MTLIELIQRTAGDDAKIQFLDRCLDEMQWDEKTGGRITFLTDVPISIDKGLEEFGVIVWLPRDKVRELQDERRARDAKEEGYD